MQISATAAFGGQIPSATELAAIAGPYWHYFYQGQNELLALLESVKFEQRQLFRDLSEYAAMADFDDFPVYHTETLYPLKVDVASVTHKPLRYGTGTLYGVPSGDEFYGQVEEAGWSFPVPEHLVSAAALLDQPLRGQFHATVGTDAFFVSRSIDMYSNPLDVFKRVTEFGREKIVVWFYMAEFDRQYLATRFGSLFGRSPASSEPTRMAYSAAMKAQVEGASERRLREVLAAAVGLPVAEEGETVEQVFDQDVEVPVVITDQRTIYGNSTAALAVSKGDVLRSGDFFFQSARLSDVRLLPEWLDELCIPASLGQGEELTMENREYALDVQDVDGKAYAVPTEHPEHPLFVYLNTTTPSLATLIARHQEITVPDSGEFSSSLLGGTVNLYEVLATKVFGSKMSVSLLESDHLVDHTVDVLRLIRDVIPPWTTHLVHFTGDPPDGWIDATACC